MDVGAALREAREQRGLSLNRLSQATKITVTSLQAIETNRRDMLPGGIFLRGFVRAYAREIARPSSSAGSPTVATARLEAATTGELTAAGPTAGDLLHLDIQAQG